MAKRPISADRNAAGILLAMVEVVAGRWWKGARGQMTFWSVESHRPCGDAIKDNLISFGKLQAE
jgi:hypothetical protein